MRIRILVPICVAMLGIVLAQNRDKKSPRMELIPAAATMTTAWDIPMNPLEDSSLSAMPLAVQIRWGFKLFVDTPHEAARFSPNKLSCNNCHLNAGQKEKAMPLVGIAAIYPEYNKREGRLFSLEDRIVGCFKRSMGAVRSEVVPENHSPEVLAISAYLAWLSRGFPLGNNPAWRGHNVIASHKLIPLERLDTKRGGELFAEKCSNCHGLDGQGVEIGDKKAGPLWGPDSWNDGAGAARIYTLAGMIRYAMPYLDPGSLTDEEAQHIAAFICSQPRPEYPYKSLDYRVEKLPPDAVYYKRTSP
jgi:thiosulfate dehydrogenase